jgi:hypothetical protein
VTYESETEPVDFGSGGGGGPASNRGGGAIQLTVAGTLTIDGRVSVNNDGVTGGWNGGGSGGSVWLTASRLNGTGSITANGQAASYPGAGSGGGGRIAIYTGVNEFAGTVAASGGQGGLQNGSSGSLYYSTNVSPPLAGTTNIFSTQFEATEGYLTATNLVGQNGWLGVGSGGNGVVTNYFEGQGQQAFIGFFPYSSPPATTNIFSTQFEATEGYLTATNLVGQNGWLGVGSGGNGVVTNYFEGQGQQAFIGFSPPDQGDGQLTVWRPINFLPIPTNMPVVQFSVRMSIMDSSNTHYDDFCWSVYNAQGDQLFTLDFDNSSRRIYYRLDGTNNFVWTGQTFTNNDINTLVITMNFTQNSWSAAFGGVLLGENIPITTTGAPLNLGDVDAGWRMYDLAHPGDNYMVFDNYQITAEGLPPDQGNGQLTVWRPINFSPIPTNMPVVQFSVRMSIVDSSNTHYDDFYWSVYNAQGDQLFTLDFDNSSRRIYYRLDGTNNWVWTGQTFANDDINTLVITMNFTQNFWSANFGGVLLGENKPITTTGAPLNLGDVDAGWRMFDPAHPGDNYMVFDNYQITAGVLPPDQGNGQLTVWRPINFSLIPTNMPVVQFSVLMSIVDSANNHYDDFYWSVYNAQGDRLFTLDFDNYNHGIYYLLDGTNNRVWTGRTFANDDTNTLVITMNFIENYWSATFGGVPLSKNKRITTTGAPLNLGDVDAVWTMYDPAHPGDNYMVFDNYQIAAEVLPLLSPPATTDIFSTQFEATEGYRTATDLAGQNGWLGVGSGGNGVVTNYFLGQGQQAFIGFFPPDLGDDQLTVWRPINFSPIAANMPVVQFSVLMSIVDSANTNYDDFYWSVCNAQGDRLFTLDFDNYSRRIYYLLDGTNNRVWTGRTFANDDTNTLVITMNFTENSWNATFGGVPLATTKPITTTGAPLNLGDVDAEWAVYNPAHPGDNYMVFDNYRITTEALPPPMVIAQYPSGSVNRFVSYVDVTFNQPVDADTFTTNDVIVTTPAGPIPASQITLSGGGVMWRISFPTQMANGAYSFTVGPHIANLFGQEMAASYSGGFTMNFTTPTATASQTGGNLSLIWSSATGLSYQLQSATNLPAASWLNEGAPLNGTGGLLTNNLPIGAQPRKFFRFLLLEN